MNKTMKWIGLSLTIIIIALNAVVCSNGLPASWMTFFLGWGIVFMREVTDLISGD